MELAGLILLILLPPEDAAGNLAVAMKTSLQQELGGVAMAVAPDSLVTPAMWRGETAQMHARFVAHLVWEQKDRARIELLAFPGRAAGAEGPRSRNLNFAPHDSEPERGRALGLVIAEMMREFPSSAWIDNAETATAAAARGAPLHVAIGARLAAEWVGSGVWAIGPGVSYSSGLGEALWLEGAAATLFSSSYNYIQVAFGAGVGWKFLRSDGGRHAVGVGLRAEVLRESVSASDDGNHTSGWNVALVPSLRAHATIWRSLRVTGEVGLRALSSGMSFVSGDEYGRKTTAAFDRWRPTFSLGLESAF